MTQVKLKKNADQFLEEPYARLLIPNEGGGYTAEIMEFPGCISQGRTADEAINNLNASAKSWLEASLEDGREIPPPASTYDYSGRIALRMPKSLHRQAAQMAERDSTSMNQYMLGAISERVGANELYNRLVDSMEEQIRSFTTVIMQQSVRHFGHPVIVGNTLSLSSLPAGIVIRGPGAPQIGNSQSPEVKQHG